MCPTWSTRCRWTIDPSGCRPEVVQQVADDIGLPVAGQDTPGAARVRGVSWAEHLRTALLHLVFGHYGHELLAKIDDAGRARLIGLSDRLPATISNIHVSDQGVLLGVSQDLRGFDDPPQITEDRLVWYCHEREGAAWYGNSLLRPAFGPWLIKQEMIRVHATSNRRFGMGVPVSRALPGTSPTPAQHAEAARMAQSVRVGDQGGAAMPPGYILELIGLTGSTPDTLAFLRYLDQQMSRMALASFLDLGVSETGSRALGTAFIDLFTLSIQAIADFVADVATRKIAARIVGWNRGEDEPVPRITVADVGSKHEVTAEAIEQLMSSGAITADPQLEAWARRAYRLPQRAPTAPAPVVPVKAQPVAARQSRQSRRAPAEGQLALPIAAAVEQRDLTADEVAAGVDFPQIQADHDAAVAALVAALPALLGPIAASLVVAVAADLAAGGAGAIRSLAPDAGAVAALGDAIAGQASALAGQAVEQAVAELVHIGLPVDGIAADDGALADHAQATAQLIASGMANLASRTALLRNGPGVDPSTVTGAVEEALNQLVQDERNWVISSLSAAMSAAQHAGRMAAFQALVDAYGDDAAVWVASEVNDSGRCEPCAEVDATRFDSFAEAVAAYPTGRYVDCLGRDRCRGALFAVPAGPRE
jgi:hypothetical protein